MVKRKIGKKAKEKKAEKKAKKNTIFFYILFLAIFFLTLFFDKQILYVVFSLKSTFLSKIISGVVIFSSAVIIVLLSTLLILLNRKEKKQIFLMWLSLAATTVLCLLLKILIGRTRPFVAGLGFAPSTFIKKTYYSWDSSFPSLHTAAVFCVLPFLQKKAKPIWLCFAVLVAFSRMYFAFHYPSDVIAGALIGYSTAVLIKIIKK